MVYFTETNSMYNYWNANNEGTKIYITDENDVIASNNLNSTFTTYHQTGMELTLHKMMLSEFNEDM